MADGVENDESADYSESSLLLPFTEIYFISLASQSNIYCCAKLEKSASGLEKVLVGSLRGKVSCIDRRNNSYGGFPSAKEIYFTYIPGDAEIISMDAFSRNTIDDGLVQKDSTVVAISLVLLKVVQGTKKYQYFLNVYTAMDPEQEYNLEDIARSCQHIELDFTPYQLIHSSVYINGEGQRPVFLLAGSDRKVHMFKENKDLQRFQESSCDELFPEFKDLPSSITWLNIKQCKNDIRVTAFGCQNGFVSVSTVSSSSTLLKHYSMELEGPISSVQLFTLKRDYDCSDHDMEHCCKHQDQNDNTARTLNCEDLCLLVTSAVELSVVYLNVCEQGFSNMAILPQSDHFDSVTCSRIADLDCDGCNEILLGTYGQELLVYKLFSSRLSNDNVHFDLRWTRSFSKPLTSIEIVDILGDGMKELVVVSLNGVHILQFDADKAAEIILRRMKEHSRKINGEVTENSPQETHFIPVTESA